jgi:hypothetical protein
MCPAATANQDTLPFAVDVMNKFVPSGFENDACGTIQMPATPGDPSCGGQRSSATALGNCHEIIYTPAAPTAMVGCGTPGAPKGYAGVAWQHPVNNWGTMPGYAIPAGAKKVTFYAKGAVGGETVKFFVGGTGYGTPPTAAAPCADPVSASQSVTMTTSWAQYSIAILSTYTPAVLTGFGYSLANQVLGASAGDAGADASTGSDGGDAGAAPSVVHFYVDDITWTM